MKLKVSELGSKSDLKLQLQALARLACSDVPIPLTEVQVALLNHLVLKVVTSKFCTSLHMFHFFLLQLETETKLKSITLWDWDNKSASSTMPCSLFLLSSCSPTEADRFLFLQIDALRWHLLNLCEISAQSCLLSNYPADQLDWYTWSIIHLPIHLCISCFEMLINESVVWRDYTWTSVRGIHPVLLLCLCPCREHTATCLPLLFSVSTLKLWCIWDSDTVACVALPDVTTNVRQRR